jgi:type I restriction enzyme S subunit
MFKDYIRRIAVGATMPSLNTNLLSNISVIVPPLPEQRAIAEVLGALDDKIELNRRMNATLEAMARAVFRQWFVENEEVGSWRQGTVGDVIERIPVGKKYDFKSAESVGAVPILDQAHFTIIGYHNEEPGVIATLDSPVLVFSNHRCYTDIIHFPFSAIQNVLPFVGDGVDTRWLFHATDGIIEYSEYKGHWPEFISKPLVIPPEDLTNKFGEFVKPIHIKIMKNKEESRTLASLRDGLLPKLMRGEVRVKEGEYEFLF